MKPNTRALALGGVIGPVAFVGSWVLAGIDTAGYSPVNDAISELAAVDASTSAAMTAGLVVYGLGLSAFGLALREELEGRAWIAALAAGVCTIGVAATPLRGWSGDATHSALAGLGYTAIVALPALTATPLANAGRRGLARVSVLTAAVSAACLAASTLGSANGLWQRLGLTVVDAWIVAIAAGLVARQVPATAERSKALLGEQEGVAE